MSKFVPGVTPVLTGAVVLQDLERKMMIEAVEKGQVTGGPYIAEFEKGLKTYTGHKFCLSCNSGSSANLMAVGAMVEAGYWRKGDHILCIAASFPTTVNPLLVYGLVPVFVDITLPDYSVNMDELEAAYTEKCTGVMIAHTLGIPYDMDRMKEFCDKRNLTVVEDCCDALGSYYKGKHVGHLGKIATTSFFPAHHISTGEGGAVFTNDGKLFQKMRSLRDWGRDCHCDPGEENACGKRFDQELGTLPYGFDHKYTYSSLGFNLKMTSISAAMGIAQITRLKEFGQLRRKHFNQLYARLKAVEEFILLPEATPNSDPSWFGFPMVLKFSQHDRRELQMFLDERRIASRLVFGGNLIRQPYMADHEWLVSSSLENTDRIMHSALWVGVWPGMDEDQVNWVADSIIVFIRSK